jgi:hypothetical protein
MCRAADYPPYDSEGATTMQEKGRTFDFDGRPTRSEYLSVIRAALDDEGLALGEPGQSATIIDVIMPNGQLRVIVPARMIEEA